MAMSQNTNQSSKFDVKNSRGGVYWGEGSGLLQRGFWIAGRFLSRILSVLLFRLDVKGQENVPASGPVLLAANHQSNLDPWLIGLHLPRQVHFMAKDSLFKPGFTGWLLQLLNAFPVKLGGADLHAIRSAIDRLEEGRILNIYPEGARSEDGAIHRLAPGIGLILNRVHAPLSIVPVVIDGAYEAWPLHQKYPQRHPVRMSYGRPLQAAELKGMKPNEVALQLRQRLVELQEQMQSPHAAASRRLLEEEGRAGGNDAKRGKC